MYDASSPFLHFTQQLVDPEKILFVFIVFPLRPHVDRGVRRRRFIEVRANLCGVASSFKLRRPRRTPLDLEKKKRTTLSLIDGVVGLGVDQAGGWVVQFARGPKPGGRASALQFA